MSSDSHRGWFGYQTLVVAGVILAEDGRPVRIQLVAKKAAEPHLPNQPLPPPTRLAEQSIEPPQVGKQPGCVRSLRASVGIGQERVAVRHGVLRFADEGRVGN
jgi:hypothetical protein